MKAFYGEDPVPKAILATTLIKILKSGVYSTKAKVTYSIGSNQLVCYSDTSSRSSKPTNKTTLSFTLTPARALIFTSSRGENIKEAVVTLFDIYGRVIKTGPPKLLNSQVADRCRPLTDRQIHPAGNRSGESLTKQIIIR